MKRLFIDLDICNNCDECVACCEYFYHAGNNHGVTALREYATFALFCRHCEDAPCVNICYHDALERQEDGHLKRYMMLCTSCKSCTIACPFGTILPDFIPYLDSKCNFCAEKAQEIPSCVASCPEGAVEVKDVEEDDLENDVYLVGDNLAVHTRKWDREVEGITKK